MEKIDNIKLKHLRVEMIVFFSAREKELVKCQGKCHLRKYVRQTNLFRKNELIFTGQVMSIKYTLRPQYLAAG